MIKLEELTPNVYYRQSRDFQFIGRLYDLVLNSIKTNTELINYLPLDRNTDSQLLSLVAMTLGFKSKHNYNIAQLTALCNVFSYALKNKGNIQSIISVCNAVLNAEGIRSKTAYAIKNTNITLYLPSTLNDITLLRDLLDYILPAGMSCTFVKETIASSNAITIYTHTADSVEHTIIGKDIDYNNYAKIIQPDKIKPLSDNYNRFGVSDKEGYISNSTIYKPADESETEENNNN